ncbi:MAG: Stp1/IreP family PP2C-type Ser/Thr phosphatase [Halobacteriota archaeon]
MGAVRLERNRGGGNPLNLSSATLCSGALFFSVTLVPPLNVTPSFNVTNVTTHAGTSNVTNVTHVMQNPALPPYGFLSNSNILYPLLALVVVFCVVASIVSARARAKRAPPPDRRRDVATVSSVQSFVPLAGARDTVAVQRPDIQSGRAERAETLLYTQDRPLVWAASATDLGLTRDHNEDAYLVDPTVGLLLVADGVGGGQAGEVASSIAVEVIGRHVKEHVADDGIENVLREAVIGADQAIRERATENVALTGMGSTVVAALCGSDTLYIVHAGDSRAYLINGHATKQITHDDSIVAQLVARGELTQDEARVHPERHVITKSLGGQRPVTPELDFVPWKTGDYVLLCSDGLTDMIDDTAINAIVTDADTTVEGKCQRLVRAANQQGGRDNITVVLAYHD